MGVESVSLAQLVSDVKITLQSRYEAPVWVVAEISEMNINRSGHCYLELIEKDTISDKAIAKCRATIWAFAFRTIKAYFETTTSETLRAGLKVLIKASVEFHEVYGFSLNVQDIDPQYTLGDMARKKAQIIKQLDDEGVVEMNKSLPFPFVPQRIAVISSETAAGFGDFENQLLNNTFGYSFNTRLFPAVMQGEKAPESIIYAFEAIFNSIGDFDVVVLMRGGGSKSDLSCFDDYDLAYLITQFPLPVLTGIGHERDDTISDKVAHTKLKTPTAVAEFLIGKVAEFDSRLDDLGQLAVDLANELFDKNEQLLDKLSHRLQYSSVELLQSNEEQLIWAKSKLLNGVKQLQINKHIQLNNFIQSIKVIAKSALNHEERMCEIRNQRLEKWINSYFGRKERRLSFFVEKVELLNPQRVLERGFAMVTHNGKLVKDSNRLNVGDAITVKLAKGKVDGEVTKIR